MRKINDNIKKLYNKLLNFNSNNEQLPPRFRRSKYNLLLFKINFFISHNKLLILMWIILSILLSIYWTYGNITLIQVISSLMYILPSLFAFTGVLYTSFSKNMRQGVYDKEMEILLEIMNNMCKIIENNQIKRNQPDLLNHGLIIELYQKNFQNRTHFILGATEQYELIRFLNSIYHTPKTMYLNSEIEEEIWKINDKNFDILISKVNELEDLSKVYRIRLEDWGISLIKEKELHNTKYKGYLIPLTTFKQFFNENELKNLEFTDAEDLWVILHMPDEEYEKLNTSFYKIYYLAFKEIDKIIDFKKF